MMPKKFLVTCNTNHVTTGSTFVAIKGFKTDGNNFIPQAVQNGATTIVSEALPPKNLSHIKHIKVKNARKALAQLCTQVYNNPCSKLKIIGITGTKGKTTTTYLVEHILASCGKKTACLSTIQNKILDQKENALNTTPQSDYIHMFLDQCVKRGVEYVVIEVSSHALSLHRTLYITFDIIGFTNLKQDHLDFYKNKINYFNAKCKIFRQIKQQGVTVINTDDQWGKRAATRVQKFCKMPIAYLNKTNLICTNNHNLLGNFNAHNATMAYLICKKLGLKKEKIMQAIKQFEGVPGRLQLHVLKNGAHAFVDFAHNPSAMKAVLQTLRPTTKDLIVVFGCGGDRDKTKRPIMGNIAAQYADKIIITDDNPRSESSEQIAQNILTGITPKNQKKCTIQLNRKKAIAHATQIAQSHSVITILGKGHENYYLKNGKKSHFDDFEEISKY
jgi:UDP-N-acetylmuramoyl-L-alanyl-D-glutamate--2,6-diaminopimelate ligase